MAPRATEYTNREIKTVLVCATPECRERLIAVHVNGTAVIQTIIDCPKCKRQSEYVLGARGWDAGVLPPRPAARG